MLYTTYTQQKGRKNPTFFKERIPLSLKPGKRRPQKQWVNENAGKYCTNEGTNTEVQINEEEIGKTPEKEFRIIIVKMIKNLENKMEKMQKSINKDREEWKNKHTETTRLLKLKIL